MDAKTGPNKPRPTAKPRRVYCDANATTFMPPEAIKTMTQWLNRGNPSSDYASAKEAQGLMAEFRRYIADLCGFSLTGPNAFTVVFTSGASESNCFMVTSAVRAYAARTRKLPHVITSAVEHKSLLACCEQLRREGLTDLTVLPVGTSGPYLGAVDPEAVRAALRPNTCLVSIMAANNETGIMNDLRAIGAVLKTSKVSKIKPPFHTDCVQLFSKAPLDPAHAMVDAFSVSFHKLHGPAGCGVLVLRTALVDGYDLKAMVCGSQNGGLRGGTEPIHNIAASFAGAQHTFKARAAKNANVRAMRDGAMRLIGMSVPAVYLDDYAKNAADAKEPPVLVVWVAPREAAGVLPNTMFLSVRRKGFCNKAARAALEARGIICSVGSACNSASHAASGVVAAMDIPAELQNGVLRFSFDDGVDAEDVRSVARAFLEVITGPDCLASS